MLFDPLTLREVSLRNRIVVSPMCQYSSEDGFANDWHLVHHGALARGGAALVFTEAIAVTPEARISPEDLGIWKDEHLEMLSRIAGFVRAQGAVPGVQLAHAGRKASTFRPWSGHGKVGPDQGGWTPVAPSAVPFAADYPQPAALDEAGIQGVLAAFAAAAGRALRAGFGVVELHAAHGYLLHEFLSPLSNQRTDGYGGAFDGRVRLVREACRAVRSRWPEKLPLFVRISSTDWTPGGWTIEDSVALARLLKQDGADLIDCSSGGNVATAKIPVGPGYQTAFAERIRREAGVPTGALGMITSPQQAEHILRSGQADVVVMARELLRDPHWPLRAAHELGVKVKWPVQYERAELK
jgi:2,4-dienoyl-CoA reductase-like NADH-dependent reductase (Old Yellow Enzyme family)